MAPHDSHRLLVAFLVLVSISLDLDLQRNLFSTLSSRLSGLQFHLVSSLLGLQFRLLAMALLISSRLAEDQVIASINARLVLFSPQPASTYLVYNKQSLRLLDYLYILALALAFSFSFSSRSSGIGYRYRV